MTVAIIGHRGVPSETPENSLAGIRLAAELDLDGVEIDVRLSLDGVPMVVHDWSLGRLTRWFGPVRFYPSFLLKRLRLRGSDERIPTLVEALRGMPDNLSYAIEVKDAAAAGPTIAAVAALGLERRVLLWSHHERAVETFAREAPGVEAALLRGGYDGEALSRALADAERLGARGINIDWRGVTAAFVAEAHDRRLRVYSSDLELDTLGEKVAAGLDGIVTERPREVLAALGRG